MDTVQTGPKNENEYCHFSEDHNGCLQNTTLKLTDDINKALMIDYDYGRLIICGSFHGTCSIKYKNFISSTFIDDFITPDSGSPIVASGEGKQTSDMNAYCAPEGMLIYQH